ncbi:unnamed protein product, partial [Didymodactylos carnosus]
MIPVVNQNSNEMMDRYNTSAPNNQRPSLAPKPFTKMTSVLPMKPSSSVSTLAKVSDVDIAGRQSKSTLSTSSDQLASLTNQSNLNNNVKYDAQWTTPVTDNDQIVSQHSSSSRNSTNMRFVLHEQHHPLQQQQQQQVAAPLSLSPLLSLTQTKSKSNLINNHNTNTNGDRHRQKISEYRMNRIDELQNKDERTEQEEKELSNLKLELEFDRRVEEFHFHGDSEEDNDYASQSVLINSNINDRHYISSIKPFVSASVLPHTPLSTNQTEKLSTTTEMNEFDE